MKVRRPSDSPPRNRYVIQSVVHAAAVLRCFRSSGDVLTLHEVVSQLSLSKGICFRILYTLRECGMLEKVGENRYQLTSPLRSGHEKLRMGYAD
jgi:DNA-binding IclR family transcriptional regulator